MSQVIEETKAFIKADKKYTKWLKTSPGDPEGTHGYDLECAGGTEFIGVFVHGLAGGPQLEIDGIFLSRKGEQVLQDVLNALHPRRIPRKKS